MKLLLHTDVLVELVIRPRESFLSLCREGRVQGWVLSTSLPDAYRQILSTLEDKPARDQLNLLMTCLKTLPMSGLEVCSALTEAKAGFPEDLAAKGVVDNKLDGVVTLETERFAACNIKALTPEEVIDQIKQPAGEVTQVPLLDIPGSYHEWLDEAERGMYEMIRSGRFILGPQVQELERQMADYCQTKHAVGVSSGTDALILALMAGDIGPGDEVITTPFTFFATLGSIVRVGAKPVLVDIDPITFNLNVNQVKSAVTNKTKAILPVHLYGQCVDMDPLVALAKEYGLLVIEDAAQAIGAEYKNKRAGSLGDIGCFSFFPTKNLGGIGDAGMVTTNSDALYEKLHILRVHGGHPKYYHKYIGGNFRLDTIQAAVVQAKLPYLDGWTKRRQDNAERYRTLIRDAGLEENIQVPQAIESRHVYNQFVLRVADGKRDALWDHLKKRGVGCEVYYPLSLHQQECFQNLGHRTGDFPESELAANETLALPNSFEITPLQQNYAVQSIKDFYS